MEQTPVKTDVILNGTDKGSDHSSGEDSGVSSPVSVKNEDDGKELVKHEGEKEEGKNEQEIVLIQDTGFTVQLSIPGMENIELPVSIDMSWYRIRGSQFSCQYPAWRI